MSKPPKMRCAVYTRKSHEEGLDQEFNSLDAQRLAGEAYIQSQIHEGWESIPTNYNDGGYSGGTLERPGLQRLLEDIKTGKVDVIVVYKVDRLSRSLGDFARLVELFDQHNVSFVSVTQQFNTTNSMGRLTLNILLSFAQFEREVTGERIRDKFAASKKKGMWMGGKLPLGYDLNHRKLIVNEAEARQVRLIFEKYLELKSLDRLRDYLNDNGYRLKQWETAKGKEHGGGLFSRNAVRTLLSNSIYIGKMRHKDQIYDGEHDAIVDQETWDNVQKLIQENFIGRKKATNQNHETLFKGKLFDAHGQPYSTTYTKRGSKRYHYYLNRITQSRISVAELNATAEHALHSLDITTIEFESTQLTQSEIGARYPESIKKILRRGIQRIIKQDDTIEIILSKQLLHDILLESKPETPENTKHDKIPITTTQNSDQIIIELSISFRSYTGRKMACSSDGAALNIQSSKHDPLLVGAIVKAYKWHKMLETKQVNSQTELAKLEKTDREYVGDILQLQYLCPDIVEMILSGTQPRTLKLSHLTNKLIPLNWNRQKSGLRMF